MFIKVSPDVKNSTFNNFVNSENIDNIKKMCLSPIGMFKLIFFKL